jgi:hypothetical protein
MDALTYFKVAFLDAGGALIQTIPMPAETVASAAQRAREIASQIDAADFIITSMPAYPQRAAHSPNLRLWPP